jgi:hypothetical protein
MMLAVIFGYLAGSVPFAFLLARRAGIDVRVVGSGNVGAANVMRTTGTAREPRHRGRRAGCAVRRRRGGRAHLSGVASLPRRQGRSSSRRRVRGPVPTRDRSRRVTVPDHGMDDALRVAGIGCRNGCAAANRLAHRSSGSRRWNGLRHRGVDCLPPPLQFAPPARRDGTPNRQSSPRVARVTETT